MPGAPDRERLDAAFEAVCAEGNLPSVSLAVVDRGAVVYRRAFGHEAQASSVYGLSSLTKPVTALAVLLLAEDGRLSLDAPLRELLPEPGSASAVAAITPRQLLSHSSGLARGGYYGRGAEIADLAAELSGGDLVFPPGSRFKYSNLGYQVLERLVARVAGRPYEDFVEEAVLKPLGMASSGFTTPPEAMAPGYQRDHYRSLVRTGDELVAAPRVALPAAAGGLASTAPDYGRFLAAVLEDGLLDGRQVLPAGACRALQQVQVRMGRKGRRGSALGFQVRRGGGEAVLHHSGSGSGHSSLALAFPKRRCGGVALAGRCSAYPELARLLEIAFEGVLGLPPRPAASFGAFVGDYRRGEDLLQVRENGWGLFYQHRGTAVPLTPRTARSFVQQAGPFSEYLLRFPRPRGRTVEECFAGPHRFRRKGGEASEPVPPAWAGLVGTYTLPTYGPVEVYPRRGRLIFQLSPFSEVLLEDLGEGRFRQLDGPFEGEPLVFGGPDATAFEMGGMIFVRGENDSRRKEQP